MKHCCIRELETKARDFNCKVLILSGLLVLLFSLEQQTHRFLLSDSYSPRSLWIWRIQCSLAHEIYISGRKQTSKYRNNHDKFRYDKQD